MSLFPDDDGEGLAKSYEFVQDLFNRRKSIKGGNNNIRIVELSIKKSALLPSFF